MDLLGRVIRPGRELLSKVDMALMSGGIPHDHAIAPLVRQVGVLPGQAMAHIADLDVEAFAEAAVGFRAWADRYAGQRGGVAAVVAATPWTGAGAAAFANRWRALGAHLGEGETAQEDSLAGRLVAMTGYLDGVEQWILDARAGLAEALGAVLGSAQAVALRSGGGGLDPVHAAADIGLRVMVATDTVLTAGYDLHDRWMPRLGPVAFVAPDPEQSGGGETRVHF